MPIFISFSTPFSEYTSNNDLYIPPIKPIFILAAFLMLSLPLWSQRKINMDSKNYQAAIDNYIKLEELAELPANIQDARLNLLKAYYEIKEYNNAIAVAKRLLPSEKLSPEDSRRAQYILAKSYQATNSLVLAQEEYKKLSKDVKSPEGAEAKYLVCQMYFDQMENEKAEKEIFDFIDKSTPQQYWIARSFILLSDVYLRKKDQFQASQTLQSIIENYLRPPME